MDPQRLSEIDSVFESALEREGEARAAYLEERCAGDPELRREVESLLACAGAEIDGYLRPVRELAGLALDGAQAGLAPGATVGAYRIVAPLGRGGMGVVALAERSDGSFAKRVAIKVLPHAMSSPEEIRRFALERQILARLAHPNIAHLLDGGVDSRGLPYLVMEHVEGAPIDRYCDDRRLSLEARLRLVIDTARAVQAAHRSLVVHRDIKPSNLLVDAGGAVKLLDFGIAKLVDPAAGDGTATAFTARALTPTYASPEQVRGAPITTASDVYQLGLLLFELVSGRRPQEATTVSLAELVRLVCEREPPPLSRAVQEPGIDGTPADELARRRSSTPERLARRCRGDLDAIVARALDKDPERRYSSAESLATDLERFLAGLPVRARRPTWRYRSLKFVRRHAAASVVVALAFALTTVYAVGVTLQARELARQRERAELEARKAREVERFVIDLFEVSDPARAQGREVTARELLERGVERVDRELAGQAEVRARMLSTISRVAGRVGMVDEAIDLQQRALAERRRLFGDEHRDVAESAQRLGGLLRNRGRRREAVPLLEEAVALQRRLAPGSLELADALSELGRVRYNLGDYDAAEAVHQESLAVRRGLTEQPAALAEGLSAMGSIAASRGRSEEAVAYHREALDIARAQHGDVHPRVSSELALIGANLNGLGDYTAAQPLLEEALAIDRRLYGDDHVEVAADAMYVGDNLMKQELPAEAEPYFLEARAVFERMLPSDHPLMATFHHRFGDLRRRQGRFVEAGRELETALTMRRSMYGPSHPMVAQVLLSLGSWHLAQSQRDRAEAVWREALPMVDHGKQVRIERRLREYLDKLREQPPGGSP